MKQDTDAVTEGLAYGFVLGASLMFILVSIGNPGTPDYNLKIENTSLIDAAAKEGLTEEFCHSKGYMRGYQNAGPGAGRLNIRCYTENSRGTVDDTYSIETFGKWVNGDDQ